MSDNPQTPGDTPESDLPNAATPVTRLEFADPDLPKTAREVSTAIAILVAEVKALNGHIVVLSGRITRNKRRIGLLSASLAFDLILTAVITFFGFQVERVSECQGRINDATRSALVKRSEAFDKQTQALETLASGVIDPVATSEQRRATIVQFRDGMRAAQQQRADNPLPTGNCG